MTKEERKVYSHQYYLKNKEKILKTANDYYKNNKEKVKDYYNKNKETIIVRQTEYNKEYKNTPMGRALKLVAAYKTSDDIANRGECTLTAKWIVENIFSKPCAHCGLLDWHKVGCNRLDNAKPHTPDNVEPCCFMCNLNEENKEMIRDENTGRFKKRNVAQK